MLNQPFKSDALYEFQKKTLRQLNHGLSNIEEMLCNYLMSCPKDQFEQRCQELVDAKSGSHVREFTLPKKWKSKPGYILGIGKTAGSPLYCTLQSFKDNEKFKAIIASAQAFVNDAESVLDSSLSMQEKLNSLRDLLATSKWEDQGIFAEINHWLRYEIVKLFRDIHGNDLNVFLFKKALESITNDAEGVQKALCDDYIYRRAYAVIRELERLKEEKISTLLLDSSINDILLREVTIPLMHDQVPYFEKCYCDICYMRDIVQDFNESREDYLSRYNQERHCINDKVKILLQHRIMQCGTSELLSSVSFNEYYESKQRRLSFQNKMRFMCGYSNNKTWLVEDSKSENTKTWNISSVTIGALLGFIGGGALGCCAICPPAAVIIAIIGSLFGAMIAITASELKASCRNPFNTLTTLTPDSNNPCHNAALNIFYDKPISNKEVELMPIVEQNLEFKPTFESRNMKPHMSAELHSSQAKSPNAARI